MKKWGFSYRKNSGRGTAYGIKNATRAIVLILAVSGLTAYGIRTASIRDVARSVTEKTSDEIISEWEEKGEYIRQSEELTDNGNGEAPYNPDYSLSVPTYVNRLGDTWFIVDCYHDRVIYNDNLDDSLDHWKVLTSEAKQPHTMASDGMVYLVDDTENNRVLIFEKSGDGFKETQVFNDIGQRPHYTVYDGEEKAFYVWSSTSGELYVFRRHEGDNTVYLTEIRKIEELAGTYIRSFYLEGNDIYFVSGITANGTASDIIKCDKRSLEVKERYEVPSQLAGMAQMGYDSGYYFITVSTDVLGNQDAATMIRVKDLGDLAKGDYEVIYDTYFLGGGTPYNFFKVDKTYYLTEHRLPAHSVWSYEINDAGDVTNVKPVY